MAISVFVGDSVFIRASVEVGAKVGGFVVASVLINCAFVFVCVAENESVLSAVGFEIKSTSAGSLKMIEGYTNTIIELNRIMLTKAISPIGGFANNILVLYKVSPRSVLAVSAVPDGAL